MSASDLVPTWPSGFDAWESFVVILALGVFKLYRGMVLKRRATYIDRFGWSIIAFDWVFGVVFLLSIVFRLYPDTASLLVSRSILVVLLVMTIWQAFEVWRAEQNRVTASIGGLNNGNGPPPTPSYEGEDRRQYVRREEDRDMRNELRRYREAN